MRLVPPAGHRPPPRCGGRRPPARLEAQGADGGTLESTSSSRICSTNCGSLAAATGGKVPSVDSRASRGHCSGNRSAWKRWRALFRGQAGDSCRLAMPFAVAPPHLLLFHFHYPWCRPSPGQPGGDRPVKHSTPAVIIQAQGPDSIRTGFCALVLSFLSCEMSGIWAACSEELKKLLVPFYGKWYFAVNTSYKALRNQALKTPLNSKGKKSPSTQLFSL